MTDPFFSLPRTTRATEWFDKILPSLPLRLPFAAETPWSAVHVHGVGGGTWSVRIAAGQVQVQRGMPASVLSQWSMTAGHFREALAGALRDRTAGVLTKLGMPVALPDLSGARLNQLNWQGLAAVQGSLAFQLADRQVAENYRYVMTLGSGPAALDTADTVIDVDLDDLATLAAARTPPLRLLASGKMRVQGNSELPLRALTALLSTLR